MDAHGINSEIERLNIQKEDIVNIMPSSEEFTGVFTGKQFHYPCLSMTYYWMGGDLFLKEKEIQDRKYREYIDRIKKEDEDKKEERLVKQMPVLVVGNKGRQGRRFTACLDRLAEKWVGCDLPDCGWGTLSPDFDKVIIATPTETHIERLLSLWMKGFRKNVLCEKPIYKGILKLEGIGYDFRMVCNWSFAINSVLSAHRDIMVKGETRIEYNCYNTGNDGTAWDCIQLIHLAGPKNITIKTDSPIMECRVYTAFNPQGYQITSRDIEVSYLQMISTWIQEPHRLWGMEESVQAHREVLEYIQLHPEHG